MGDAFSRFGKRRTWGAVLLIVALLALLNRYLPGQSDSFVLPVLGVGFIVSAVISRRQGLLIPGGVLLGVGCGIGAQRFYGLGGGSNAGQAVFLGCLALGFLSITLLSLTIFRSRVVWPLWPALFVGLASGARLMGAAWQEYLWRVVPYWPFALLVIGLLLLLIRPNGRK